MNREEIEKIVADAKENGSGADLRGAYLRGAYLSGADLRGAYLRGAYLSGADLSGAYLSGADLSGAYLRRADLSGADLSGADLSGADLRGADLSDADLSDADLRGADLSDADLSGADLSGSKGLLSAVEFMARFETTDQGWIVYKRVGKTQFDAPKYWTVEPGSFLQEVVNPCRTTECACGVNFGTRDWCEKNYTASVLWKCLILWEDGSDIVVPYNTDGKARCGRMQLLEVVT